MCRPSAPWLPKMASIIGSLSICSAAASAGIVYFENPADGHKGHFNWHMNLPDDPETWEQWLDITKPSTEQLGGVNGFSVGQLFRDNGGDSRNITAFGAAVAEVEGTVWTRGFEFDEDITTASRFEDVATHVAFTGSEVESDFPPDGSIRYIGVLTVTGNYGWIAASRHGENSLNLTTTGWAYETIPGKPILAGQIPAPAAFAPLLLAPLVHCRRRNR